MRAIFVVFGLFSAFLLNNWSEGLECYSCDGADNITDCPVETCPEGETLCVLGGLSEYRVSGGCTTEDVCKGGFPGPFPPCGYCCKGDLCNNHTCYG